MESNNQAVVIEWYRVRLVGDPVLSETRTPGTKNNRMYLVAAGDGVYSIQDLYPDGRYTVTDFNEAHVMEFIYKAAGSSQDGE